MTLRQIDETCFNQKSLFAGKNWKYHRSNINLNFKIFA